VAFSFWGTDDDRENKKHIKTYEHPNPPLGEKEGTLFLAAGRVSETQTYIHTYIHTHTQTNKQTKTNPTKTNPTKTKPTKIKPTKTKQNNTKQNKTNKPNKQNKQTNKQ
jgi:hypothetical protein